MNGIIINESEAGGDYVPFQNQDSVDLCNN